MRFEERTIRIAVHFYRYFIFTFLKVGGNIKRGYIARVFRETYIFAIDPQIEERVYPIEINKYFASIPIVRHFELAHIGTYLIAIFIGCPICWRCAHYPFAPIVDLAFVVENHGLIHIDRQSVFERAIFLDTIDIPIRRYGNGVPF